MKEAQEYFKKFLKYKNNNVWVYEDSFMINNQVISNVIKGDRYEKEIIFLKKVIPEYENESDENILYDYLTGYNSFITIKNMMFDNLENILKDKKFRDSYENYFKYFFEDNNIKSNEKKFLECVFLFFEQNYKHAGIFNMDVFAVLNNNYPFLSDTLVRDSLANMMEEKIKLKKRISKIIKEKN